MSGRPLVRVGFGLAIVAVLIMTLDGAAIGDLLRHANLALLAVGVAGLVLVQLLGAATWRLLTEHLIEVRLTWRDATRWFFAGQALGAITPGNLGGDVYRVAAVRDQAGGTRTAALPIVVQRVTSYVAVAILAGTAVLATARNSASLSALIGIAIIVTLIGAVVAALVVRRRAGAGIRRMGGAVGIGLCLNLVFHLAAIGCTYLLVITVDPAAGSPAGLAAIAIARVALLIPITPSGLGFHEVGLSVLFVAAGLPAETALAAALLGRLAFVLTVAIGAAALASGRRPAADRESFGTLG